MPFTLTMPKLSPTMESGVVAKWHKKVGDQVEAGDLLLEVSTDKATVEYNALDDGWLRKILVKEGGEASVNQAIAVFTEEKKESIEGYVPEGEGKAESEGHEVATPSVAHTQQRGAKRRDSAGMGGRLAQPEFAPAPPLERYQFEYPREMIEKRVKASPLARKLAKEKGMDLSTIQGTGPGGRIVERDLERAQPAGYVGFSRWEAPKVPPGTYEEEKLTPMRKAIGQRLQEAKTFIPHFYASQEVDVEKIVEAREQLTKHNVKVTYNDFVVRACALALRRHPEVNSGFYAGRNSIIRYKTIDIAVAVSIEEGLITPIIRHADYKNLGELSTEVKSLAARAREGKLAPEDYQGGSFTISNLGMYGVTSFQAILNPPQAAILAVSAILDRPVVKEGKVVPGKVMTLTLSADHRVIDGIAAAKFLQTVKSHLENPATLLL